MPLRGFGARISELMMKRILILSAIMLAALLCASPAYAQIDSKAFREACILKHGGNWDNLNADQKEECGYPPSEKEAISSRPNLGNNREIIRLEPIILAQSSEKGAFVTSTCIPELRCTHWSGCLGLKAIRWPDIAEGKMRSPLSETRGCEIGQSCGLSQSKMLEMAGGTSRDCIRIGMISTTASEKEVRFTMKRKSLESSLRIGFSRINLALLMTYGGMILSAEAKDVATNYPSYQFSVGYKYRFL